MTHSAKLSPDTACSAGAGRIAFLDYLRIFAFTSVVAGHQFYSYLASARAAPGTAEWIRVAIELLMPFAWSGAAGVTVFFFVSGYIITHVIRHEAPATFAIRRVFRIYPLYIVAVVAEAVVAHVVDGVPYPGPATWVPRLLLVGDFFGTPYALKNVEWTLRLEVLFYAFVLACRVALIPGRMRALPWLYVLTACLLAVLPPFPNFVPWTLGIVGRFLPMLFVGSLVYLGERRIVRPLAAGVSIAALLLDYQWVTSAWSPANAGHPFLLLALGLFLVLWSARSKVPDSALTRHLAGITYAVYLFHHWLWPYLSRFVEHAVDSPLARDGMVFGMLVALSFVMVHVVEQPAIRLGARWARRRPCRPAGAPPASVQTQRDPGPSAAS